MASYTSTSITVQAVQWTGGNLAEVQAFAGGDFISENAGRIWVRNAAGPYEVPPGYWLTRRPGEPLVPTSPAAWARHGFTAEGNSDEDRIRDAMAEAQDHPGRMVTR